MNEYEVRLKERGIKVTAVRLLVLREMMEHPQAFSLADLERRLDTVDKSTLSRTINLFRNKLLIHSIDDGTGSVKYSVCDSDCECSVEELHVHFHCNRCGNTYCLESIPVPEVGLPENFRIESANFVLKGLCDKCAKHAT